MKIGFIGAGGIALALARQFLKAGHDMVLSKRRGPASLAETLRPMGAGARAGTRAEAAQAELLVLSVPWQQLDAVTAEVARLFEALGFALVDLGGLASGGRLQQFPGGPLPALNLVKLP